MFDGIGLVCVLVGAWSLGILIVLLLIGIVQWGIRGCIDPPKLMERSVGLLLWSLAILAFGLLILFFSNYCG